MFTAAELAEHRADAESRQVDTCRITRPAAPEPGEEREIDPETLAYIDPDPVVVYEGKCRIPRTSTGSAHSAGTAAGGEQAFQVDEYPLALPVAGSGYVENEDVTLGCTVTYLTSARDATLPGRVFGITGMNHQTDAVERRFRMKEVVGS